MSDQIQDKAKSAILAWVTPILTGLTCFFLVGIYNEIKEMGDDVNEVVLEAREAKVRLEVNTKEIEKLNRYHER